MDDCRAVAWPLILAAFALNGCNDASVSVADANAAIGRMDEAAEEDHGKGAGAPATLRALPDEGGAVRCSSNAIGASGNCDTSVQSAAKTAAGDNAGLIGGWVIASESCRTFGLTLNGDGTYTAEGENGRWRMESKTLRLTATGTYELGSVEPPAPVRNARPVVSTIMSSANSAMTLRFADGTIQKLKKCPVES